MEIDRVLMIGRWFGLILIVLAWFQIIPLQLGWFGFAIAAVSFIMESVYKKNLKRPNTGAGPGEQPGPGNSDKKDT